MIVIARSVRRLLIPTILSAIGIMILIGCIPIPLREKVIAGRDFRPSVRGDPDHERLNIGMARQQVELILGKPGFKTDEGRTVGYLLKVRKGVYLIPLCFTTTPRERWYLLRVRYDTSDRVQDWDIKTEDSSPIWAGVQIPGIVQLEFPRHFGKGQTQPSQSGK